MKPDWRDYERQIHQTLFVEFLGAKVIDNLKMVGKISKTERQIDIGIKIRSFDVEITMIGNVLKSDCSRIFKRKSRPLNFGIFQSNRSKSGRCSFSSLKLFKALSPFWVYVNFMEVSN